MQSPYLDQENPLEEEMANHSSTFAWEIPWTEEPGGYSPQGHKESDTTEQLNTGLNQTLFKGLLEGPENTCDASLDWGQVYLLVGALEGKKADSVKL